MKRHKGILAIDFDNTIAKTNYPEILGEIEDAKLYINKLSEDGWYIIVNTCRYGEHQLAAENFLIRSGIHFDLINENHRDLITLFSSDCRKMSADVYIDDKNLGGLPPWSDIYNILSKYEGSTSLDLYYNSLDKMEEIHE